MRLGTTTAEEMARRDNRRHQRAAVATWRVVRFDGVLLGGYSREADAERVAWVINREGMTPGVAHVVAPRSRG